MSIHTILFDLDATLLPMDQDAFIRAYFARIGNALAPLGYDKAELSRHIWTGTGAMVRNDGRRTNEQVFWDYFAGVYGDRAQADKPFFDEFYRVEFQRLREFCTPNPQVPAAIAQLKAAGYPLVLATNPVFPAVATENRIRWAGLEPLDFIHRTTYENASYCKPNPAYYTEILKKLDLRAEECLMVGNDARDDLAAEQAGISVFLLTDCLINTENRDISSCPQGGFPEMLAYIHSCDK